MSDHHKTRSAAHGGSNIPPGTILKDRYIIQECLGSGASSMVYKAIDKDLGSLLVAVKVFHQSFMSLPGFSKLYSRELQTSFAIDHENVVRLYDMIKTESLIALVTEFIDGYTLETFAQRCNAPLPDSKVREILLAVTRGLNAIHSHGLIHRDVKPQNILISRGGTLKINDFGLAKQGTSNNPASAAHQMMDPKQVKSPSALTGTPYYTSPEYLTRGEYDQRGDLHSLGIIGYELLANRPLFDVSSPAAFIESKIEENIPPVNDILPNCSPEFAHIIDRLVVKNPDHRFQSCKELLQALETVNLEVSGIKLPESEAIQYVSTGNNEFVASVKRGGRSVFKSIFETIVMLPYVIFVSPFKLLFNVFGGSAIIYPVVAVLIYLLFTQTDFLKWFYTYFG